MKEPVSLPPRTKRLRVGVLDLAARQPDGSLYARLVNPNQASIMPQVIAAWAEQLGHEVSYSVYTGSESLFDQIEFDIDLLFISSFTQCAYLAYSVSTLFRQRDVVTVLGGPHARAYARDACNYFDYVVEFADKALIQDLLSDPAPNPGGGVVISAGKQPRSLPGVAERWKFTRQALDKALFVHLVPMVGSLGCPYACSYCVDSQVPYQPLPYDQIREDLVFLQQQPHPPLILWSDPNFGVRFDEYMNLIESTVKPGNLQFSAESSLSLLSEPHLQRLRANNFIGMAPGIESWFEFNNKSKAGRLTGIDKVKAVADQVRMITEYIPYVQTNFIFGLDSDSGETPFDLTKKFIDLAPGAYPNYSLITAFGDSAPLSRALHAQGRVMDVPFPFVDGDSMLNVRLSHYSVVEFYDYMIDLVKYTFSPRVMWRRFHANERFLVKAGNAMRGLIGSEKGRPVAGYSHLQREFATNREWQDFYCGESDKPPSYFQARIKAGLGPLYEYLPPAVVHHLEYGDDVPNTRIGRLRNQVRAERKGPALFPIGAVDS